MEKCLKYLEEVDEDLILQICKYAEFYCKNTFETLYIDEPPASAEGPCKVLNLSGGCDWEEDEGIQCLVKNGEVIFLGGFNAWSVWRDYSRDYIGNYVLYTCHVYQ